MRKKILKILFILIIFCSLSNPVYAKKVKKVGFFNSNVKISVGEISTIQVYVKPSNAKVKKVEWYSNNPQVVIVNNNGTIKGLSEGQATIIVRVNNTKTAYCIVTVVNGQTTFGLVGCNDIKVGKKGIVRSTKPVVKWKISKKYGKVKKIKKNSKAIKFKAIKKGKVRIAAIHPDKTISTCDIKVYKSSSLKVLNAKKTKKFKLKGCSNTRVGKTKNISSNIEVKKWKYSNNKKVKVISKTKTETTFSAKKTGTITIKAISVNNKTAKCKIKIKKKATKHKGIALATTTSETKYGVFLGLNKNNISKLNNYNIVVIEPEEFSEKDVTQLKTAGKTVWGYLNIGSIENNRSYYKKFRKYTIGKYDGWPDERWIDISKSEWQDYVVERLAKKYVNMGYQGFYVDNLDVYSEKGKKNKLYKGGSSILKRLKALNVTVMVNGADEFVLRTIKDGTTSELMDAINQEEVFTKNNGKKQNASETKYYKEYLKTIKQNTQLRVFLLEYGTNKGRLETIKKYCAENGFDYYYSKHKNLD